MKAAVRAAARAFTAQYEGCVSEMYVDVLGLVTCAIGNLVDPMPAVLGLPWIRRADGQPATAAEIAAEWQEVKSSKIPWYPHRGPRPIYLADDGINTLFFRRLDANDRILANRWPNWDQWPADAQLGAHSCAWAAGGAWRAPAFDAAVGRLDFQTCAGAPGDANNDLGCRGQAWLNDAGNPGLRPRNLANKVLFWNAAVVLNDGRDPEVLYFPTALDG